MIGIKLFRLSSARPRVAQPHRKFASMPIVRIEGWRPGFNKVEHTKVLRATTEMSLADAKSATDRVLNGGSVDVARFGRGRCDATL
jgi:hypothetical protein